MIKLPAEVEAFAKKYFAAEAAARPHFTNDGLSFQLKDKKALARACKVLLESDAVENLHQLSVDLSNYKPGNPYVTHTHRLKAFAKVAGVTYPRFRAAPKFTKAKAVKPKAPAGSFSIRSELIASFSKALTTGMTLAAVQAEARDVLIEANQKVQETKVAQGLQALMRNSGLTAGQIANIAQSL